MSGQVDDPYGLLGLQPGATSEQVRQAYFQMVRVHTPEAHPVEFKRVRAAYEKLRSARDRAELALLTFDESVVDVDLDLLALAVQSDVDLVSLVLAAELSVSDFACAQLPDDVTPVRWEDLLDR